MGRDFSHGHYSEEGVEGTHRNCLCSYFDEKYIVSGSGDYTIKVHMCGRRRGRGQRKEGTEGEVGRGDCVKLEMLISYQYVVFRFHVH